MDLTNLYRPGTSLSCVQCDESFESHASFKNHMKEQHGESHPYHCDRCDKCYGLRNILIQHIEEKHLKKVNFQCAVCQKEFYKKSNYERHRLTHEQKEVASLATDLYRPSKSLMCTECTVLFHSHSDFINHMGTQHNDLFPYHCPNCPRGYQSRKSLITHLRMKQSASLFNDLSSLPSETELCDVAGKIADSDAIGKCSEFQQHDDLDKSDAENNEPSLSSESEAFGDAAKFELDITHNEKLFITKRNDVGSAPELSGDYKRQSTVVQELFRSGISLSCTYCDLLFESHTCFKTHMDQQHGESKPYHCDRCDKCYGDRSTLIEHIKSKHLDKVNYECAVCHKQFYFKSHWEQHRQTHMQNGAARIGASLYRPSKSLSCSACSLLFHSHSDFINHMRTEHDDKTPYRCPKCPKRFQFRKRLIRHLRMKHLNEGQTQDSQRQCVSIADDHSSLSSEMEFFEDLQRGADSDIIGQLSELYVEKNAALEQNQNDMVDIESSLSSEFQPLIDAETADILQHQKECKTNGNDEDSIIDAQCPNDGVMSKDSDKEFLESIQNWDHRECAVCRSTDSQTEHLLLRCDGCDLDYHPFCVGLDSVPDDLFWFCSNCKHLEFDFVNQDRDQMHGLELRLSSLTITENIE